MMSISHKTCCWINDERRANDNKDIRILYQRTGFIHISQVFTKPYNIWTKLRTVFRFMTKEGEDPQRIYSTTLRMVGFTSFVSSWDKDTIAPSGNTRTN